ncbi:MAG TPA: sulfur carrier protein ThiS [Blastocatellia bacterium]|nr:sulfur carrier protein ThiS [Blastocatellia bacterium]
MVIQVNGEEKELADGATVAQLIESLALKPERIAIELNRKIMRRAEWASTSLSDGDKVEVVHFVGGGGHFPFSIFHLSFDIFRTEMPDDLS